MNIELLTKALQHYVLSAECHESDRDKVFDAIAECNELNERLLRDMLWDGAVYLVSAEDITKILNITTYDIYGKLARSYKGNVPFGEYEFAVRKQCELNEMTIRVLMLGYDVISDLWLSNEESGDHNPDGTFMTANDMQDICCEQENEDALVHSQRIP